MINIAPHLNSVVKQGSEYNLVLLTRVGRLDIVIIHIWHKADLDRGVNALAACRDPGSRNAMGSCWNLPLHEMFLKIYRYRGAIAVIVYFS